MMETESAQCCNKRTRPHATFWKVSVPHQEAPIETLNRIARFFLRRCIGHLIQPPREKIHHDTTHKRERTHKQQINGSVQTDESNNFNSHKLWQGSAQETRIGKETQKHVTRNL